jgi:hypothetical protein
MKRYVIYIKISDIFSRCASLDTRELLIMGVRQGNESLSWLSRK